MIRFGFGSNCRASNCFSWLNSCACFWKGNWGMLINGEYCGDKLIIIGFVLIFKSLSSSFRSQTGQQAHIYQITLPSSQRPARKQQLQYKMGENRWQPLQKFLRLALRPPHRIPRRKTNSHYRPSLSSSQPSPAY